MNSTSDPPRGLTFGRFQVLPERREVLADGRPTKLGGRAFDVLITLIEARGAVVSKEALMARVWPGRTIEENSLAAQIAALRAALGAERALIRTVSGRGYQFTGEIRILSATPQRAGAEMTTAELASVLPPTNVPEPAFELIGREEELSEILNLVTTHRLVTLTGAGGIGKTTLALALARELRPHFGDGVWLAELSALADPGLVPATVATAIGLQLGGGEISPQRVAQALADRRVLLVLDTCEHLIAAAAAMAEATLGAGSAPRVIATSREPLRAGGEWVYPVQPLAVPAADVAADDDPLRYGAVRLFIERARAAEPHFAPDLRLIAIIAEICRRLDGIPLAIELAAARAAMIGIEALAARIEDRFRLLTGGRRMAPPRHQALRATLDWSYALLAEPERVLLRRLATFAGPFSLEAAATVAASPELAAPDVIEGLLGLIAKSLVVAEGEGAVARYRLLDTTRAYALEKLGESGERERIVRRHAEFYRDLFERADAEREVWSTAEWLGVYGWRIGNLRAALDWAFSADGDASIGVALTADAVRLWMHLSLVDECRARVEQALSSLASSPDRDARREMQLHAAFGASLIYMRGPTAEVGLAWANAFENAESLGDIVYQLRALRGLWAYRLENGEVRASLILAQRCSSLAANHGTSADSLVAERMIGTSLHYLGDQTNARRHIEGALRGYITGAPRPQIGRYTDFYERGIVRAVLARILWLQGFPDQALHDALTSVEEAHAMGHVFSLCNALVQAACPVALWVGDLPTAERCIAMLLDYSGRHGLDSWHLRGRRYQALLMTKTDPAAGLRLLGATLEELRRSPEHGGPHHAPLLGAFAEALGAAGQATEGLIAIDEALALSERAELHASMPELLRVKGDLLRLKGESDATVAEGLFRQALDLGGQQGALSWELRAAISLARQRSDQGRPGDALACLLPIYDRFTEGFEHGRPEVGKSAARYSAFFCSMIGQMVSDWHGSEDGYTRATQGR